MRKILTYFIIFLPLTFTTIDGYPLNEIKSIKEVRISLKLENITLEQALMKIEEITKFRFVYSSNSVDKHQVVNFNAYDVTIANVLDNETRLHLDFLNAGMYLVSITALDGSIERRKIFKR